MALFKSLSLLLVALVVVLLATTVFPTTSASGGCDLIPKEEFAALESLYDSTRGQHWNWYSDYAINGNPWNFTDSSVNPCLSRWQGLTCDLGNCTVTELSLPGFNLTGRLPSSLDQLRNLTYLGIKVNSGLTGSIPSSLGNLSQLIQLELNHNALTGPVPLSLNNLHQLTTFYIQQNFLTSSLPIDLAGMFNMVIFDVRSNFLTGHVPTSMLNMTKMESLYLYINLFSGPLPQEIGDLKLLGFIDVRSNFLSSSLPASLSKLNLLQDFFAYNNRFTGPLPANLSQMHALEILSLDNNSFTGPIPHDVYDMSALVVLSIANNLLSQSMVTNFSNMHSLGELSVSNNSLTGTLPMFCNLRESEWLRFDSNFFGGTLPNCFEKLTALTIFNISDNYFTGSVPISISSATALQTIDFSLNGFTGSLGNVFASLPHLQQLMLRSNRFRGGLSALINVTAQPQLSLIDISDNSFDGSLPNDWFTLVNLTSLVAAKNCITGSLPSTVCLANQSLVNLVLDGLHSSTSCQKRIFQLISTYSLTSTLEGSLPSCLFEDMSQLSTLHLSGNGMMGTLPALSSGAISASLTSLSVSHNRLIGTIPSVYQRHVWNSLDLSFNRLSGTIDNGIYAFDTNPQSSLSLNINRLSGHIPHQLLDAETINILQGNMFSCGEWNANALPQRDPYADSYSCGSNVFDAVLYAWIAITTVILLVVYLIYRTGTGLPSLSVNDTTTDTKPQSSTDSVAQSMHSSFDHFQELSTKQMRTLWETCLEWWSTFNQCDEYTLRRIYEFGLLLKQFRAWCYAMSVVLFFIALPLYAALSTAFGTFTNEYAWTLSMSFVCGSIPAGIVFVFFALLLFAVYSQFLGRQSSPPNALTLHADGTASDQPITRTMTHRVVDWIALINLPRIKHSFLQQLHTENAIHNRESFLTSEQSFAQDVAQFYQWYAMIASLFVVNVALVLSINMLYIYALSQSIPTSAKDFLSLLLSVYKIVWNNVAIDVFSKWLKTLLRDMHATAADVSVKAMWIMPLMLWISLFNNIVAPLIAVAFISPNCFYYAVQPAPSVESSIVFQLCTNELTISGANNTIATSTTCDSNYYSEYQISYEPPFTYGYQCSSTLLVSFADIFVLRFLIGGFCIPIVNVLIKVCQEWTYTHWGREHVLYRFTSAVLPMLWKPLSVDNQRREEQRQAFASIDESSVVLSLGQEVPFAPNPKEDSNVDKPVPIVSVDSVSSSKSNALNDINTMDRNQFRIVNSVIVLSTDIAVILTFGVIFPPVALVGCITLALRSIAEQLVIGRLIVLSKLFSSLRVHIQLINAECKGVSQLLWSGLSSFAAVVTIFWSIFLFDTLGDFQGFYSSLWVLAMLPVLAIALPALDALLIWLQQNHIQGQTRPPQGITSNALEDRSMTTIDESIELNEVTVNPLSQS